jgi:hypothetical protein
MKISYGLTVCNEDKELENLITYLKDFTTGEDEIVIVYDQNRVTDEVKQILQKYKDNHISYPFDFKQNYLDLKNYLNSKCNGDYIFQLDADEIPEEHLIKNLKTILETNPVDLLMTPRKNLVKGLTQKHIQEWRWNVNEKGWVNWPDTQKRIYRNNPNIKWTGHQVHGMVSGFETYAVLPLEENWSIIHNKTIDRQESQNERYAKIETGELK